MCDIYISTFTSNYKLTCFALPTAKAGHKNDKSEVAIR